MVVTVKSVKKTFLDFVDVADVSDESEAEAATDKLAACTWPVSCLRVPSGASDDPADGQQCEPHGHGDSDAGAGFEYDAEEAQLPAEAESADLTETVAQDRIEPFVALSFGARASEECTSPLVDPADASSPMWIWHKDIVPFHRCGGLDFPAPATRSPRMPSLPGMAVPLQARNGLQAPGLVPRPATSVQTRPTARKPWIDRDNAYVKCSVSWSRIAAAATPPLWEQSRSLSIQHHRLQQEQHPQQQQQQQSQIQRADPNRLERRRHPARARDRHSSGGMGDASEAHTTIMIRNLPNNYTRDMLLQLLRSGGFATKCDFVYLPIDFHTQSNLGYAFVNFQSTSEAHQFWQAFDGFNRWVVPSRKVASLRWSDCQGLEANIARYRNSPVMCETVPSGHKPVLFSKGVQVEFPAPTKVLRAPRLKQLDVKSGWNRQGAF